MLLISAGMHSTVNVQILLLFTFFFGCDNASLPGYFQYKAVIYKMEGYWQPGLAAVHGS